MPTLIPAPSRVEAAGAPPKLIDEYVGRVSTPPGRSQHGSHAKSPGVGRAWADS